MGFLGATHSNLLRRARDQGLWELGGVEWYFWLVVSNAEETSEDGEMKTIEIHSLFPNA